MSRAYLDKVSPTYIENWNPALYRLSVPQLGMPLVAPLAQALEAKLWNQERRFRTWPKPSIEPLLRWLDQALRQFPGGAFVRLGSRSGKDSVYARMHGLRVKTAKAAIQLLTQGSERVAFDLQLALHHGYTPHLFVRQWVDMPPWAEFRCFLKERRLVGISQYDCKRAGHYPEIARHAGDIQKAITSFLPRFLEASHLDDVVADVFCLPGDRGWGVHLIELNPFFPKTDPCLFSWSRPEEFDGSLRFL